MNVESELSLFEAGSQRHIRNRKFLVAAIVLVLVGLQAWCDATFHPLTPSPAMGVTRDIR
jgi:hypothetical protein